MKMNEDVHKMRVQILNLRGGMMTLSTALCRFPVCGTPMGCNLRCSEAGNVMRQIHEEMHKVEKESTPYLQVSVDSRFDIGRVDHGNG